MNAPPPNATMDVLVLCTGNSARSVMAEALFAAVPGIAAWSAGSSPAGRVNPEALATLARHGLPAEGYRSKSWDEFAADRADAPRFDLVVTVCDSAAGETCPLWHGAPLRAHWGIPDPAGAADEPEAFERAFGLLEARVGAFAAIPRDLPPAELRDRLAAIGRMDGASEGAGGRA